MTTWDTVFYSEKPMLSSRNASHDLASKPWQNQPDRCKPHCSWYLHSRPRTKTVENSLAAHAPFRFLDGMRTVALICMKYAWIIYLKICRRSPMLLAKAPLYRWFDDLCKCWISRTMLALRLPCFLCLPPSIPYLRWLRHIVQRHCIVSVPQETTPSFKGQAVIIVCLAPIS